MHIIIAILLGCFLFIACTKIIKYSFIFASVLLGLLFGLIIKVYRSHSNHKASESTTYKEKKRKQEFIRELHLVE
jgi:energy-coupling factor transporter transmembrane protein EcfT